VCLFADGKAYERDVWAVFPHPHRAHLPARVSAFVEHLAASLRAEELRPPRRRADRGDAARKVAR
jgi:hypothetical protein